METLSDHPARRQSRLRHPAAHPVPVDHVLRGLGSRRRARPSWPGSPARPTTSGFFYIAVCDHTFIPERLAQAMGTTWYDTVATLGWLAGITEPGSG